MNSIACKASYNKVINLYHLAIDNNPSSEKIDLNLAADLMNQTAAILYTQEAIKADQFVGELLKTTSAIKQALRQTIYSLPVYDPYRSPLKDIVTKVERFESSSLLSACRVQPLPWQNDLSKTIAEFMRMEGIPEDQVQEAKVADPDEIVQLFDLVDEDVLETQAAYELRSLYGPIDGPMHFSLLLTRFLEKQGRVSGYQ